MKKFKASTGLLGIFLLLPLLVSCAAGSATAGYAIKAREADRLSPEGEQRMINRVKSEMRMECYQG